MQKNSGNGDVQVVRRNEPISMHNIVTKFMEGNHGNGHCVMTDYFFISIKKFEESTTSRIYAVGIIQPNKVEHYKNSKTYGCSTVYYKLHWLGQYMNIVVLQVQCKKIDWL